LRWQTLAAIQVPMNAVSVSAVRPGPCGAAKATRGRAQLRWARITICSALLLFALPAHADKTTAATSMSREALSAYDAGDYSRAGQLYEQAFKIDPKPEFLFGAARSAHLFGDLEKAEDLYRKVTVRPNVTPALVKKAQDYIADVRVARSEQKAREAQSMQGRGDKRLAAQLWQDAFALNPQRVDWLVRAGRLQEDVGDKDAAIATYRRYIQDAPATASDQAEAHARLAILAPAVTGPAPGAAPPAAKPALEETAVHPVPVVEQSAVPSQEGASLRKLGGWASLGAGGVLTVTGIVFYALAAQDDSALQSALARRDAQGHITGVSLAEARTRQDKIDTGKTTGVILGGVGVAAMGLGAWLWLGEPAKVAVLPTWNGANLTMRW